MIKSVTIKNLRGIREGELSELTPLVVLVGPNSSGKSTILDALLIGASPRPGEAVGNTVSRRPSVHRGARWLLWRSGANGTTTVSVTITNGVSRTCLLVLRDQSPGRSTLQLTVRMSNRLHGPSNPTMEVHVESNNTFSLVGPPFDPLHAISEVRLIDPQGSGASSPFHELYSRAVENGRRAEVTSLVAEVVPGVIGIEILTDEGNPIVHLVFVDHSVPAGLAGDGIQSLLRLSLELASLRDGVALLEEPEVHEHPAAIRQSARAIVTAIRRGVQVVLSTHSLEMIDALLAELKDEELPLLSLYRLKLTEGILAKSRLEGPSVLLSRGEIGDDLR